MFPLSRNNIFDYLSCEMLALFVCVYRVICHITQTCFHSVRVHHAVSICPFQWNNRVQVAAPGGLQRERERERQRERERMIFKKVPLSRKPISLKWLRWYLVSSILWSMNDAFVAQARVKNVINSTALYGGRQPAHKCVLKKGYISVFRVLASYLWPLSSLILPFLITCPFFSSSLLTSHPCPLTDG